MKFAVIDIECTGGTWGEERIIDVAVFLVEEDQIIDQFISLVNPQRKIDPFVAKLTGITDKMVRTAPRFHEIAKRLVKITEDAVFVAHNISFDYRVFQQEFAGLGFDFHRATLDTIPYAEKIFPGWENYGLKTVSKELRLPNSARHRAEGDARLTMELLKILRSKDKDRHLMSVYQSEDRSRNRNPFREEVKHLSNKVGTYYIFNADNEVVFIGSSDDLQNSINRHFIADNKIALALQQEAKRIQIEEWGNKALAEVNLHLALQNHRPVYNAVKKKRFLSYGLFPEPRKETQYTAMRLFAIRGQKPPVYFESPKRAMKWLQLFMMDHGLDPRKFVFEKDWPAYRKLSSVSKWPLSKATVSPLEIAQYVLPAECMYIGKGRTATEKCAFIVERHNVVGYFFFYLDTDLKDPGLWRNKLVEVPQDAYINSVVLHYATNGNLKLLQQVD